MNTVDHNLLEDLASGYADYLVTFMHDFFVSRGEEIAPLVPEYQELLARLGSLGARSAIAYVANPLLAAADVDNERLRAVVDDLYADIPDDMLSGMAEREAQIRRAAYLLEAIPDRQRKYGQMYPDEVEGMEVLVARGNDADEDGLVALLPELEDMWTLVQPGVRYHRGDADWVAALQRHLEDAVERLHGEDLEAHLIQKAMVTLTGSPEIRAKARGVLDQNLAALAAEKEELEGRLAEIDVSAAKLREKKRALL